MRVPIQLRGQSRLQLGRMPLMQEMSDLSGRESAELRGMPLASGNVLATRTKNE
jgi:hypothetical protein